MVEVKDVFVSYRCQVFVVRSEKSGDTRGFLQGVNSAKKLDRQWFMNFYRSMVAEFGFGPNTENLPNRYV